MKSLTGRWVGNIYGTNFGNAYLEITSQQDHITGILCINEQGTGVYRYSVIVQVDEEIILELTPDQAPEGVELKPGKATAILHKDGSLTGRWETELGTMGTFRFYQDNTLQSNKSGPTVPEQVFSHTMSVGSVRLYKPDLERLMKTLSRDFCLARPTVTYLDHGVEVTKFSDDLLAQSVNLPLKSLKISIQEQEPSGFARLVNIDLLEGAGSRVQTSATDEAWVIGKAQTLCSILRAHESKLVSVYRHHGLMVNGILFLIMLVIIPEISYWKERAYFVGGVFALLTGLQQFYKRWIPNTLVFVSDRKVGWWSRTWPSVLSWIGAVVAAVLAALITWFILPS